MDFSIARGFLRHFRLNELLLERYALKLRESGVMAQVRAENELIFPTAQKRAAYPVLDELEQVAKKRRVKVRKYAELEEGIEIQVIQLEN